MLKVIPIVHKLIWLAADTWKWRFIFISNYLTGLAMGLISFSTPLALSQLVGAISHETGLLNHVNKTVRFKKGTATTESK